MESKEPVIGSTMPSYGDMSEDDKNKSGLNTLIKNAFQFLTFPNYTYSIQNI